MHDPKLLHLVGLAGVGRRDLVPSPQSAVDDGQVGDGAPVLVVPGVKDQGLEGCFGVTARAAERGLKQ